MRAIDADALLYDLEIVPLTGDGGVDANDLDDIIKRQPTIEPDRKTENALRLLVEWAIECGFGYNSIPKEYEKYKDDISGMKYTEGLLYIAKMEAEHERQSNDDV